MIDSQASPGHGPEREDGPLDGWMNVWPGLASWLAVWLDDWLLRQLDSRIVGGIVQRERETLAVSRANAICGDISKRERPL